MINKYQAERRVYMKLEIKNFEVEEVKFGKTSSYANGVLTINKEEAL